MGTRQQPLGQQFAFFVGWLRLVCRRHVVIAAAVEGLQQATCRRVLAVHDWSVTAAFFNFVGRLE